MLSDPTRQIADGCFVGTIYCVFTVFPVLTRATSLGDGAGPGELWLLQCPVHPPVHLPGLSSHGDL